MSREAALSVVSVFASLALLGQILAVVLILLILFRIFIDKKNKTFKSLTQFLSANSLSLAFLVALVAMSGSLFFSEIAHFVPCKLCWYQRILMYPQVLLLGIAAVKNDFGIKKYILSMSIIGIIIAIYHYVLQVAPFPLPCTDEVANCALKQITYYGYITIPLMSLTAFVLITLFMLFAKNKK